MGIGLSFYFSQCQITSLEVGWVVLAEDALFAIAFLTKSVATDAAIETLWSPPTIMALMPTTSPFALTNGPPELPGASGASERTMGNLSPRLILRRDQGTDDPARD